MDNVKPCDAVDPLNRQGFGCCYRLGHSTELAHRFVKENNMDEKNLIAKREAVRKALNEYEGELEVAMEETPRGSEQDYHLQTSFTQVKSAQRVLWLED
jgi:hypothetical protein